MLFIAMINAIRRREEGNKEMLRSVKFETMKFLREVEDISYRGMSGYGGIGNDGRSIITKCSASVMCGEFSIELECGHTYIFLTHGIGPGKTVNCVDCDTLTGR